MDLLILIIFILFLTAAFFFLIYVMFLFLIDSIRRSYYEAKYVYQQVCIEVRMPRFNEYEIANAEQMYLGLHSVFKEFKGLDKIFKVQPSFTFEIVAWKGKIIFVVVCPLKYADLLINQIKGAYPTAEANIISDYNIFPESGEVAFTELQLQKEDYYPIIKFDKFTNDPLNVFLGSMSSLNENEALVIQVLITPASNEWQKKGRSLLKNIESEQKNPENKSPPKLSQDVIQAINEKISKIGYHVSIRLISVATNYELAEVNLRNLEATFKQFSSSDGNYFGKVKLGPIKDFLRKKTIIFDFINRIPPIWFKHSVLNVTELATIFHFPNKKIEVPIINWLLSKKAPPDEKVHTKGLWLGVSNCSENRDIAMGNIEDRRRHLYIIGQTGTGKSFFLQNLILQDIEAGHGLCFIDPHGDSVEWILGRIPPHRIEDVIYWNPGDFERPFGFNILENRSEEEKHFIVNAFYKMIVKLFDPNQQGITGPILERAIRSVLLTAMAKKGGTLIEAMKCLLLDWDVINDLKQYTNDPFIRDYWEKEIPSTPEHRRGELMGYFTSKLDRFVSNRLMRNIIGQTTSSFDLRQIMDTGKILLINLSKGLIGEENSQFLGLLLVPKVLSAAMSRVDIPMEQRRDFFLYVDEFQNFATDDFATILSEARKFRLNLIVANQYIGQMQENVKNAVFGNVGSIVAFNVGAEDSKFLENIFNPPFTAYDLSNLENQNAYVKLMVDGTRPAPFSMRTTLKYIPKENKALRDLIVEISRMVYGRDINLVEADILKRMRLNK